MPPRIGSTLWRAHIAVNEDFYRQKNLIELFASIFPKSHYNPGSSPAVVHQTLRRLRQQYKRKRFPVEVSESKGLYRALVTSARPRRYPARWCLSECDFFLKQMKSKFFQAGFGSRDFCLVTGLTPRKAQYLLQQALALELIIKTGSTRAARYRFHDSPSLRDSSANQPPAK